MLCVLTAFNHGRSRNLRLCFIPSTLQIDNEFGSTMLKFENEWMSVDWIHDMTNKFQNVVINFTVVIKNWSKPWTCDFSSIRTQLLQVCLQNLDNYITFLYSTIFDVVLCLPILRPRDLAEDFLDDFVKPEWIETIKEHTWYGPNKWLKNAFNASAHKRIQILVSCCQYRDLITLYHRGSS